MKKVQIEGIEYTIEALKPWQVPYLQMYLDLAGRKPANLDEAEKNGKELEGLLTILLKDVKPEPREEHKLVLFNIKSTYSQELVQETLRLFRGPTVPQEPLG